MARDDVDPVAQSLLARLGDKVRAVRGAAGFSRKTLAEMSGVSERYLAQLEGGTGNISISLLHRVAIALGCPIASLLADEDPLADDLRAATPEQRERVALALTPANRHGGRIALIGLRGAGKSTLGSLAATRLGLPFHELNDLIAEAAGLSVTELFALYGQEGYREMERTALGRLANGPPVMLAVAGGIVSEPDAFQLLLGSFRTVWLKARPEEHMTRVRAQGDERPMAGNPQAMRDLRAILTARETLYSRADLCVNTSGQTPRDSLKDLLAALS